LNFTHSLSSDIFNLSPNAAAKSGEIVTGSMVVNLFKDCKDLKNNDEEDFSELFSNEHSIITAGENSKEFYQIVAYNDYEKFIGDMRTKIRETAKRDIAAFVLYISSHGLFNKGGKYIALSGKRQAVNITKMLEEIFVEDKECRQKSFEIPKIIFVDTCHGDARDHLDVVLNKNPVGSKNQSKNTREKPKTQAAGGTYRSQDTNTPQNLENFIIFHASVQQNSSWDEEGSRFLKVLKATIAEPKNENSLDIMKLSFDLVKNIDKEPDFASKDENGVYLGQVKLMCETDVNMIKNFSLKRKIGKIDSGTLEGPFVHHFQNFK